MAPWYNQKIRFHIPGPGLVLLFLMIVIGASPALAEMKTGSYDGDDSSGRLIDGLGFEPILVIVKGDNSESGVIRTDIYLSGNSKQICAPAQEITNGIRDFTPDGFVVDRGVEVNSPGVKYHWVAFSGDPNTLISSWYQGDGSPDHVISGLGFSPQILMIFGRNNEPLQVRFKDMPLGSSSSFEGAGLYGNNIKSFQADGFTLGSDPAVNQLNEDYAYVAMKADGTKIVQSTYMGDGIPGRDIGPLGIGPDYVIVKSDAAIPAVHRSRSQNDPWSAYFIGNQNYEEGIINLKGDHFQVGASDEVNAQTTTYYYLAFNETNPVTASSDLELYQNVSDTTPDAGQEITLDLTLWNNSGPDEATNITVNVPLPSGLTYVSDFTLSGSYDKETGVWQVGDLWPNIPGYLRVTATVDPGTEGQSLVWDSFVSGMDGLDPDLTDNSASTVIVVNQLTSADLELSGWWDDDFPDEGQEITLSVMAENLGPDDSDIFVVSVPLPAGLTFVSANPWYGSTYDEGTNTWTIPSLGALFSTQLDIVATVDLGTSGSTLVSAPAITAAGQPDPDASNNSITVPLIVRGAELALSVMVDNPAPGVLQDVNYTVDIVNNGPDDAHNLKVDINLEEGLDYLSYTSDSGSYNSGQSYWTIPVLGSGEATQLRLLISPLAGTDGDTLTTICEIVEIDEADPDISNNQDSVDVIISSSDLAVTIAIDDSAPDPGQQVVFTVGLENLGPDDVTGAAVTVALPVGLTYVSDLANIGTFDNGTGVWTIGSVTAGGTAQLQLTASVDAGTSGATLTTAAQISAVDQGDPEATNNSATVDAVVPSADLAIAIGVDNSTPDEGQQLVYSVVLDNLGPDEATGTEVTVTLSAGLTFVSDTPGTGTYDSSTGVWTIGPVAAMDNAQLQVTAVVEAGTGGSTLTTVAAVSAADRGDVDVTNNTASADVFIGVVPSSDLSVSIIADKPTAIESQQVVFTIDLNNLGPDAASNAQILLSLPAGLTYSGDTPGTGTFEMGTGLWTIGPVLPAGSAQLQVTAMVDAGTGGSVLTSAADVVASGSIDPFGGNNSASAIVNILNSADLALAAAFDNFNPLPGDTSVLTVVLTNTGPNSASGIRVDMDLPPDLTLEGASASTGNWDDGVLAWTLPNLAPAGSDTLNINLTVGGVAGGTELTGKAVIGALTEIDPDSNDDTATASMVVRAPGEIRLVAEPFDDSGRRLLPGGDPVAVLLLGLINDSASDELLQTITISNPVTGSLDQFTQDAAWKIVQLWRDDGVNLYQVPGAEGIFVAGQITFGNLNLPVPAGGTLHLAVKGAASVTAPDGLSLQPTIDTGSDLVFSNAIGLEGSWPLTAPGSLTVDGMTAAQITLHPTVGAEVFQIGSVRNLALDVTLPANGDVPDLLTKLNILNLGTGEFPQVIARMESWADDGDGIFNAALDTRVAELRWTGGQRFEASALNETVAAEGLRVFVTVDIAEDALGGTVRLSLPAGDDLGVGMASGNDGPIDVSVANPLAQTVSATDRVIITTASLPSRTGSPGETQVQVLHLLARNLYANSRTVSQLDLTNITLGDPGADQVDLDGTVAQLLVQMDGDLDGELDGPEIDPVVGSTTWQDGSATFSGLGWTLSPDQVSHLFITASIDLFGAADGDVVGAVVGSANDVLFREVTAVVGDWPLDSNGRFVVDGMVADQVACPAVPPVSLTANEGPVVALDITVPGNGYLDDTLQTLRLANFGTAVPADIAALGLYDDQNGNGIFEPGSDPHLADFTGIGQDWVVLDLALPIPANGRRLFAGLTVASTPTDSATVQLSVPVNGLDMISSNDGPRDVAVTSPTSLLMSTAPLLSNLRFEYDYSTTEMTVTVTMTVQNVGGEDVTGIIPQSLTLWGDGGLTMVSGPQPASLDLTQGAAGTFDWVYAGQSQGQVSVTASCEGTGAVGGQPRGSLASGSASHTVLDPAVDLDLYPVANMPFSINRGQTDVVPMTLTLLNSGGPERADLSLDRIVVTLDDGDGNPVIPADLLAHVTVNEGTNVFCDRGNLETSGQTMTLDLNPPVVVTDSEPVTLGLRLDILGNTDVDRFRVILMEPADLTVTDNVSHLPRTVRLSNNSFPVMSAAGSIVSQATGLLVSSPVQSDLTGGAGQEDLTLLSLELTGSGDDQGSEVKVGGFEVTLVDTLGQALADASAILSRLWVEGPLGTYATHDLSGPADSLVVFELLPQVTVPVGSLPVQLTVHGQLPDDPILGPIQLRLKGTGSFDARDGNNAADVQVTYLPAQITGPRVTIQGHAPNLLVAVAGELPPVISLGAKDVLAMTVTLAHPGPATAASVLLDTLYLNCMGIDHQPQDPDAILDGYRVFWQGMDLNVPVFYDNQKILVPLGGILLDPLMQGDLQLRVDVEINAPAGGFELVVPKTGFVASDYNLGIPIPLATPPGYSLPASSNLTRLQPPSEDVVAGWLDRMPPLLPTDDVMVEAMRLVLTNPAPTGAAPAELSSLVLHAADHNGQPLAAGAVLSGVEIVIEGALWAQSSDPAPNDSTLVLAGSTPLTLHPQVDVSVVVKVSGRMDAGAEGVSLGLLDGDVVCVQPGSSTLVSVSPAAGETFPFWTAAAGLGQKDLAQSYINFPNPFAAGREQTSFVFNLDQPATVTLCIWTPRGESVTTLLNNKSLAAGLYQDLIWDGRNGGGQAVRNGVYLAELKVQYQGGGSERLLRKVAVVR